MISLGVEYRVKGARVASAVCEALVDWGAAFTVEPLPDGEWEIGVKEEAAHMLIVEAAIEEAAANAPVYCGCGELLERDSCGNQQHVSDDFLTGADGHEPGPR